MRAAMHLGQPIAHLPVSLQQSLPPCHTRALLLADPSLGNLPDIRQPESTQPLLGILPRSKRGIYGCANRNKDDDHA